MIAAYKILENMDELERVNILNVTKKNVKVKAGNTGG